MQSTPNDLLLVHVPANAVEYVKDLITQHRIKLRITRQRQTKLGDFKPASNGSPHKVSINGNLNTYEFLLVFLHELAHLRVFEQHGQAYKPHGKAWKEMYGAYIRDGIARGFFHRRLQAPLMAYSYRVKASGVADIAVARVLRDFDRKRAGRPDRIAGGWLFLEEIPEGAIFKTGNGRMFRKVEKKRTRYACRCERTRRPFLIHGAARVMLVKQHHD